MAAGQHAARQRDNIGEQQAVSLPYQTNTERGSIKVADRKQKPGELHASFSKVDIKMEFRFRGSKCAGHSTVKVVLK
jgi:hypothetical protein